MTALPHLTTALDRHGLHVWLWENSDRMGRITVRGPELSDQLGITKFHLSRILGELQEAGRMKLLARGKAKIPTFIIADPAAWS